MKNRITVLGIVCLLFLTNCKRDVVVPLSATSPVSLSTYILKISPASNLGDVEILFYDSFNVIVDKKVYNNVVANTKLDYLIPKCARFTFYVRNTPKFNCRLVVLKNNYEVKNMVLSGSSEGGTEYTLE